jgi:hypothetical protein
MLKPPTSLFEILANLWFATQHDLLLDDALYTVSNLKTLSGGKEVRWLERSPVGQSAHVTGFGEISGPVQVGRNAFEEAVGYDLGRDAAIADKTSSRASIVFRSSDDVVSFEQIERGFGRNWEPDYSFTVPHGRALPPPTHPHGYGGIRYVLDDKRVSRSVTFRFSAAGNVSIAEFKEELK